MGRVNLFAGTKPPRCFHTKAERSFHHGAQTQRTATAPRTTKPPQKRRTRLPRQPRPRRPPKAPRTAKTSSKAACFPLRAGAGPALYIGGRTFSVPVVLLISALPVSPPACQKGLKQFLHAVDPPLQIQPAEQAFEPGGGAVIPRPWRAWQRWPCSIFFRGAARRPRRPRAAAGLHQAPGTGRGPKHTGWRPRAVCRAAAGWWKPAGCAQAARAPHPRQRRGKRRHFVDIDRRGLEGQIRTHSQTHTLRS